MLNIDKIFQIEIDGVDVSKSKIIKYYAKKLGIPFHDIKLKSDGSMFRKLVLALKKYVDD